MVREKKENFVISNVRADKISRGNMGVGGHVSNVWRVENIKGILLDMSSIMWFHYHGERVERTTHKSSRSIDYNFEQLIREQCHRSRIIDYNFEWSSKFSQGVVREGRSPMEECT